MASRTTTRRDSVNQSLLQKTGEKQTKSGEKEGMKTPKSRDTLMTLLTPETKKVHEKGTTDRPITDFDSFRDEIRSFFDNYDTKLDKKLNSFDLKFTSVFEELKKEMNSMRSEVFEARKELTELKTKVDEVEKSVEFQAQLIDEKEESTSDLMRKYLQEIEELKKNYCIKRNMIVVIIYCFMVSLSSRKKM